MNLRIIDLEGRMGPWRCTHLTPFFYKRGSWVAQLVNGMCSLGMNMLHGAKLITVGFM